MNDQTSSSTHTFRSRNHGILVTERQEWTKTKEAVMTIEKNDTREDAARRPSTKLRIAAAQLRVNSDKRVRRTTPVWIQKLAAEGK
jgi:hypothetical protein